ncbi:hypothetical protein [Larkinella arboricola]
MNIKEISKHFIKNVADKNKNSINKSLGEPRVIFYWNADSIGKELGLSSIDVDKVVEFLSEHGMLYWRHNYGTLRTLEITDKGCKWDYYESIFEEKLIVKTVMGDNFENISGTVINRSLVSNSFNKVRDQIDEESAKLLEYITLEVEKSGNKDAVDLMEGFHKEIQQPEPKKSILKNFWNGLVIAIPSLISNADKVMDIIEKIGKIIPF